MLLLELGRFLNIVQLLCSPNIAQSRNYIPPFVRYGGVAQGLTIIYSHRIVVNQLLCVFSVVVLVFVAIARHVSAMFLIFVL